MKFIFQFEKVNSTYLVPLKLLSIFVIVFNLTILIGSPFYGIDSDILFWSIAVTVFLYFIVRWLVFRISDRILKSFIINDNLLEVYLYIRTEERLPIYKKVFIKSVDSVKERKNSIVLKGKFEYMIASSDDSVVYKQLSNLNRLIISNYMYEKEEFLKCLMFYQK